MKRCNTGLTAVVLIVGHLFAAGSFITARAAASAATLPAGATVDSRQQLAAEAAVWGMPIVSVDAMREAFFRDAGAAYNDIVFWSRPADWKNQTTTPNSSSLYVYFNFNLKDGPVALDLPAAEGAGIFGSVLDAWQVPLADVGPAGEDEGKGESTCYCRQASRATLPRATSQSRPRRTTATRCCASRQPRRPQLMLPGPSDC